MKKICWFQEKSVLALKSPKRRKCGLIERLMVKPPYIINLTPSTDLHKIFALLILLGISILLTL